MKQLAALSRTCYDSRLRREVDELFPFAILNNDIEQEKSTAELDGQFVHSQLLVDCLQTMKSTSKEIDEFVQFCRDHNDCKDNETYLKLLEEFRKEYSSDKSLWWYTRDSFVYRMLNKALREQNIDVLFAFRFLIRDLAQQLRANQLLASGSVYRGQSLSKYELNRLKESSGKLISINSFLSTTLYREVATIFLRREPDLEQVLFKIDFDPMIDGVKPFADITLISDFPQEGEMLFMLGSIFRIDGVHEGEDGIWTIQLNLCGDNDQDLKPIFQYLRQESNRCELDLLAFGNVLHDMCEFEQAKIYYNRCLKLLPSNDHVWKAYCYYLQALIATENGENECALHLFKESLFIRARILHPLDPSLGDTYSAIARVYYINCDFEKALEFYKNALFIFHQAFGEDGLASAMTNTNMGVTCKAQQKYSQARDYQEKALAIRQKHLPLGHFRFGTSYNNIGEVYQGLKQYETAMKYYDLAFEVYKKSLPLRHVDHAILLVNKALIYEKMVNLQEALSFHKKALGICCYIWRKENSQLQRIKCIIENTEYTKTMNLFESLETIWIELFRPFKCIASLDPRTLYRETHQLCTKNDNRHNSH
jgi:tetratricopeptide (TPR) repeat protein